MGVKNMLQTLWDRHYSVSEKNTIGDDTNERALTEIEKAAETNERAKELLKELEIIADVRLWERDT